MVYLKHKKMLLISTLDISKKSYVEIDDFLKYIYIPKELDSAIFKLKHLSYIEKYINEKTSIIYI
jgi:hypothetical protein